MPALRLPAPVARYWRPNNISAVSVGISHGVVITAAVACLMAGVAGCKPAAQDDVPQAVASDSGSGYAGSSAPAMVDWTDALVAGEDTSTSSSASSSWGTGALASSSSASTTPSSGGFFGDDDPSPSVSSSAANANTEIAVSSNLPGSIIVVRTAGDAEELQRFVLGAGSDLQRITLPSGGEYDFEARMGPEKVTKTGIRLNSTSVVDLPFSERQIQAICRNATCMIRTPTGHGSGFVLGDRQTIATAAHVLTARNADEIKLIFDVGDTDTTIDKGIHVIHFDGGLDVALMHLDEPLPDERAMLVSAPFSAGMEVLVVGNPGQGEGFDALYTRNGVVQGGRSDEFHLDIEVKGGFSGGPVCDAHTGAAVGIVSYKIVGSEDYKELGRSFAKSCAIANDAWKNWVMLNENEKKTRLASLETRFNRLYMYRCSLNAANNLMIDSMIYAAICIGVARNHEEYMAAYRASIPQGMSPQHQRIYLMKAHEDYMKNNAANIAKQVRDEISAELSEETEHWCSEALADKDLPDHMRKDLEKAETAYKELREAAEKIVDSKRGSSSLSAIDFANWAAGRAQSVKFATVNVVGIAKQAMK